MELSELKRIALYLLCIAGLGFAFLFAGPYALESTIKVWSRNDNSRVLLVGDFHPKSPTDATPIKNGFLAATQARKTPGFLFATDLVSIDESIVDQVNGPSESDNRILNDDISNLLINKIATENVVAIVTASSSQTVGICLKVGKIFNIPVLITSATETDCIQGYDTIGIGYRLVANNHNQVPKIVDWVNEMTHVIKIDTVKTQRDVIIDTATGKQVVTLTERYDTVRNSRTVGILYLSNKYGQNLRNELTDTFQKMDWPVITFAISNTNNIVYAMQEAKKKLAINIWIAICYGDEAKNIVAMEKSGNNVLKKEKSGAKTDTAAEKQIDNFLFSQVYDTLPDKILFCEAAYGNWMTYGQNDTNFYALHTDSIIRGPDNSVHSEVAEDAYYILEYCLSNINTTAKADLISHLTSFPTSTAGAAWHMQYAFWSRQGENTLSQPHYTRFSQMQSTSKQACK